MLKGVGDFEAFLVGGLLILAILLAVFNVSTTGLAFGEVVEEKPLFTIKNIDSAVPVGPKKIHALKTLSFNIDAENVLLTRNIDIGTKTVENGLLFGNRDIRYRITAKDPVSLFIGFEVVRSNQLEPLVIKINNKVVKKEILEPGQYGFLFNEELDQDMLITISAVSSSWKIWAPNLYELKDITISVTDFSDKQQFVPLQIGNELRTMTSARLDLNFAKAIGSLRITMNGEEIFSGIPANAESIVLGKKHLQEGDNTLNFFAGRNSAFKGTGVLVVSYFREEDQKLMTLINLTRLEFAGMHEAVISFKTFDVARDGGLSIKMIHNNEVLFSEFDSVADEKLYEYTLSKNNLQKGPNLLVIESIDGAIFSVADLDVKIR